MTSSSSDRVTCIIATLKKLFPRVRSALTYEKPYEFLLAVMLSAQTTDVRVNKVTPHLFTSYPSLQHIAEASVADLADTIRSIGLSRTKAQNMKATAQWLLKNHEGRVPTRLDELIVLPGVGRKTANVVIAELGGEISGIAVDTHVIRLAQKYGLSTHADPIKIERDLISSIPRREWKTFTLRLILYGREYCPAHCKTCPKCPLWKCIV